MHPSKHAAFIRRWPYALGAWSVRHPRRVIALLAALVVAAAPGLARLKVRTDGHALVPPDDPAVEFDAEVRRHFDLRDPLVILIETSHPEGIFNLETLGKVQRVSDALVRLPEIGKEHVVSLATERRDRVFPGTLTFRPYLNPMPDSPALMTILKQDVEAAEILYGTLLSRDATAATVLVGVPAAEDFDRTAFYRDVVELVRPLAGDGDRIRVVGAPVAEALLGDHIIEDLTTLLPLALAVIAVVIWWGSRRWWCVGLAGIEVVACLVWTFGLMGWVGAPVFLTTAILPVILSTLGIADEIHLFWCYQRVLAGPQGGEPHPAAVLRTMGDMARPITLTSLTTSLGFLSFLGSSIAAVRLFGLFAALGILFCMIWSLTVIPAALALLPPERLRRPHWRPRAGGGWIVDLLRPVLARPAIGLAAVGGVTAALALGVPRLYVQDSWIDGFAPGSAFRRDTDRANALLHGTHLLLAHLTFDPPAEAVPRLRERQGPLLSPALLNAVGELEAFLRGRGEVGGVLGTHSHLSTVAYLWLGRREGTRRIPETPQRVDLVLLRFDRGRGEHRRREVVDDDLRRTVVTIFLKNANYRDTATLMEAIRGYERQHLQALGGRVDFAGDVAVSQAMIPAIVRTQVSSTVLAPLSCLAIISLLYGSVRTGLLAVLPASVAVLWVFGGMGWAGVPLGVATSMFCAIALGIAVDYAIHFLERYRGHRQAGEPAALEAALAETGPAIASDVLAIALGFGLLSISRVPANARLGLLVAAALVTGCLLTFVGLGSLLRVLERRRGEGARPNAATAA